MDNVDNVDNRETTITTTATKFDDLEDCDGVNGDDDVYEDDAKLHSVDDGRRNGRNDADEGDATPYIATITITTTDDD